MKKRILSIVTATLMLACGTGLDLSIVKHTVMYHKSKIELEKGTAVKVLF